MQAKEPATNATVDTAKESGVLIGAGTRSVILLIKDPELPAEIVPVEK